MIMLPLRSDDDSNRRMLMVMAISLEGPRHGNRGWLAGVMSIAAAASTAAYFLANFGG